MGAIYSEPEKYTVSTQTPGIQNHHGQVPPEVVREVIHSAQNTRREKGGYCSIKNTTSAAESCTSTYDHNNMSSKEQSCGRLYSPRSERKILPTQSRVDHQTCSSDKRRLLADKKIPSCSIEEKKSSQRVERRSTNERHLISCMSKGEVSRKGSRKVICKKPKQDESSQKTNNCYCVLDHQEELIKKLVAQQIKKLSKEMEFSQNIEPDCNLNKRPAIAKSNSHEMLRQLPPINKMYCKISIQREDSLDLEQEEYDGSQEDIPVDYSKENSICDASKPRELRSYEERNGNFNREPSSQKSASQESLSQQASKDNIRILGDRKNMNAGNEYSCYQNTRKLHLQQDILETSKLKVSRKENSNAKSLHHAPSTKKVEKPITIVPCNCPRKSFLPEEFSEDFKQDYSCKNSKQRELPAYDQKDEDLHRRMSTSKALKGNKNSQAHPNTFSYSSVTPPNSYSSLEEQNSQAELEKVPVKDFKQDDICKASKQKGKPVYEEEDNNISRRPSTRKSCIQKSLPPQVPQEDNTVSLLACCKTTKRRVTPSNIDQSSFGCSSIEEPNSQYELKKEPTNDTKQDDICKTSKQREGLAYNKDDENLRRRPSTKKSFLKESICQEPEPPKNNRNVQPRATIKNGVSSLTMEQNSCCCSSLEESNSQEQYTKVPTKDYKQHNINKTFKQRELPAYEEEDVTLCSQSSSKTSCLQEAFPQVPHNEDRNAQLVGNCKTTKQEEAPPNMEQNSNSCVSIEKAKLQDSKQNDISKTFKQKEGLDYHEDDENLCRRPLARKSLPQVQPKQNKIVQPRTISKKGISSLTIDQNSCCCSSLEEPNSQEQYTKVPTKDYTQHNISKTSKQKELPANTEEDENLCCRSSSKTLCLQEALPQVPHNDDRNPQLLGKTTNKEVAPCKTTNKEVAPSNMEQNSYSRLCDEAKSQDSQLDDICKASNKRGVPTYEKDNMNVCRRLSKRNICLQEAEVSPNGNINSELLDICKTTKNRGPCQSVQWDDNSGRCPSKRFSLSQFVPEIDNSTSNSNISSRMEPEQKVSDKNVNIRKSSVAVPSKCSMLSVKTENYKTNEKKENISKVEQDVKFCNCPIKRDNITSSKIKEFDDSTSNFASISETSTTSYHSIINNSRINIQKLRNEAESVQCKNQGSKLNDYGQDTGKLNSFELECLNEHNRLRALHNCPPLTLNTKLSQLATNWAINISRSKTIRRDDGNRYGENMYISVNMNVNGATPVKSWYTEISKYDFENPSFHPNSGHFSQVIWKDTKQIGVGIAIKDKSTWIVVYYNPPGNLIHKFETNVPPLVNNYEEID